MGLDISYYSNIKKYDKSNIDDDEGDNDNLIYIYPTNFKYQLGSLIENSYYDISDSKRNSFCAGSYSGYGYWRNLLAIMAGYGSSENVWKDFYNNMRYYKLKKINGIEIKLKPFYALINFSDCESVIGNEISKELYQNFFRF
jgi:hypothetical protein